MLDSRGCETWIRRRRRCKACGRSFTTYETVDIQDDLTKIKPEDVLRLRALATEILNRTNSVVHQSPEVPEAVQPLPQQPQRPPFHFRH